MKISIFGTGYVGLVTGACLADVGHQVMCVDVDAGKIARLERGEIPIHEPGLDEVVARNLGAGTIEFTTDVARAAAHAEVQFIDHWTYISIGRAPVFSARGRPGGPS